MAAAPLPAIAQPSFLEAAFLRGMKELRMPVVSKQSIPFAGVITGWLRPGSRLCKGRVHPDPSQGTAFWGDFGGSQ